MEGKCPNCGATIDLAVTVRGEHIPLELAPDTGTDAPRYRVIGIERNRAIVEKVAERARGAFQPDHRHDCSAFNAGR